MSMDDGAEKKPRKKRVRVDVEMAVQLAAMAFSISSIAEMIDTTDAAVAQRLRERGANLYDGRKPFMESVYADMDAAQQQWLLTQINQNYPAHQYVRDLINQDYQRALRRAEQG